MAPHGIDSTWLLSRTNRDYVEYVARLASLSLPVAQVLINRGIKSADQVDAFLNPSLLKIADPMRLPGMEAAVRRIRTAVRQHERILVHGDYDADGVTATAILVETLTGLGADADWFIPTRADGYGFGKAGLVFAKQRGAGLIVTVDCGITAVEAVSEARSMGMDVVITDHHEPLAPSAEGGSFILPGAAAVVNPKLSAEEGPDSFLSGAGVAYKLALALMDNDLDRALPLLDLACLGTLADVVTLIGDNRIFVREGMALLQRGERPGIAALKEEAGIRSGAIRTSALHFGLIPRLNAPGRMDDAKDVVRLLITRDRAEAEKLASWCNGLNLRRQAVEESVHQEALGLLKSGDAGRGPIVLAAPGWHHGVVGIVASKLAEAFNRPALVFAVEGGIARGSARSIPALDIHDALAACSHLLRTWGGHKQAAGVSLDMERIDAFRQELGRVMDERLDADALLPVLNLDAELRIGEINAPLIEDISRLEPFGLGNEEPLFGARGVELHHPRIVGNNHLKLKLRQQGKGIDAIGFDLGGVMGRLAGATHVDAAFLPVFNDWDGSRFLQVQLRALRPSVPGR